MDLATITMERGHAREAFLQYRRAVRARHDQEDQQIMRGYRALAQGRQLIRLTDTLRAGGTTEVTFRVRRWAREMTTVRVPRLAVIRADARMCFTEGIDQEGGCQFAADRQASNLASTNRKDRVRVPGDTFEQAPFAWGNLRAIVPTVPPPLRPADKLGNYLVLWEAEWAPHPPPPGDPALLKHIGGDLYAVVAIWDLTELERAVLAARA